MAPPVEADGDLLSVVGAQTAAEALEKHNSTIEVVDLAESDSDCEIIRIVEATPPDRQGTSKAATRQREKREEEMPQLLGDCMDGLMQWAAEQWPPDCFQRDWFDVDICMFDVKQIVERYGAWSKAHGTLPIPDEQTLQITLNWVLKRSSSNEGKQQQQHKERCPISVQKEGQGSATKWLISVNQDKGSFSDFLEGVLRATLLESQLT